MARRARALTPSRIAPSMGETLGPDANLSEKIDYRGSGDKIKPSLAKAQNLAIISLNLIHHERITDGLCMTCEVEMPCPTRVVLDHIPQWEKEFRAEP